MPIRITDLVRNQRWVTIPIDDQELRIAYRPNALTMEMLPWLEKLQATEQGDEDTLLGMAEFFVGLVASP